MTKRMLIDATHAEETRVVVMDGNRLEDFDVETQSRRQLKGNIYLAKVVRVEPSLQAAFVEYGGNRHGFLAFGEIHPDYYQIPVADRQRLLQLQEEEARAEEEAADAEHEAVESAPATQPLEIEPDVVQFPAEEHSPGQEPAEAPTSDPKTPDPEPPHSQTPGAAGMAEALGADLVPEAAETPLLPEPPSSDHTALAIELADGEAADTPEPSFSPADAAPPEIEPLAGGNGQDTALSGGRVQEVANPPAPPPEMLGGETAESDEGRERRAPRFLRNYKIQEVVRRRQILLVQVVKEERGTKGAALTTYISLAGRYCVLMPNSPRGGGISRKITSIADRRRLKEVTTELQIPRGMGLIVRTAGANRPKPEIKRDCEYLLRLWDDIRDLTLRSMAPALIHEEASLIKRAIRDVYSRDVDELLVDGEDGWKAARDYMRLLMPTHAKKVQLWREPQPLFAHQSVEAQLDLMLSPTVQLRSGGYLVIDQTEALVAIDVNSGRSTRERGIEETALRTNLEAADEAARQVRLRDLAGLIVIDFIDMESKRNINAVERRLKDALRDDRARIQLGSISHFGLLEMSRQRLRPSLAETSLSICPHCNGAGRVRSTESAALHVLRAVEEEGAKRRAAEICVYVAPAIALYLLNHKRERLAEIEARYAMRIGFAADGSLQPAQSRIERLRPQTQELPPLPIRQVAEPAEAAEEAGEEALDEAADEPAEADEAQDAAEPGTPEEAERRRRRRRRRRRGSRPEDGASDAAPMPSDAEQPELGELRFPDTRVPPPEQPAAAAPPVPGHDEAGEAAEEQKARGGRGRRGGRRRKREEGPAAELVAPPAAPSPAYAGPTPADPFAQGGAIDIFDAIELAEAQRAAAPVPVVTPIPVAAAPEPVEPTTMDGGQTAGAPAKPEPTEPVSGPAIRPMVIGADEAAAAEKKRGWWRR